MNFGLLILALNLPSLVISDKATLEKQVREFALEARRYLAPDDEFVVGPVDWNNLVSTDPDEKWPDQHQALQGGHEGLDCLLNAARFVFQRKFNVQLGAINPGVGFNKAGDWIFWNIQKGRYYEKFPEAWAQEHELQPVDADSNIPRIRDLKMTESFLVNVGLKTEPVALASNDPADPNNMVEVIKRATISPPYGKFMVVAGRTGTSGHTFVIYDTKTVQLPNKPPLLYVLVYDPWTGKNAFSPTVAADPYSAGNWMPATVFLEEFGLFLRSNGKPMSPQEVTTEKIRYYQHLVTSH